MAGERAPSPLVNDPNAYSSTYTGSAVPAADVIAGRAESPTLTTTMEEGRNMAMGGVPVLVGVPEGVLLLL